MKANLFVVGGFAAAALMGMAGVANADQSYDKTEKCGISTSDDSTTLRITHNTVTATRRDAKACEDKTDYYRPHHEHGYWPGHSYWPGRGWSDNSWYGR